MPIFSREDKVLGKVFFVEDHQERPIQGVFGKNFVPVDSFLSNIDLNAINDEICFALAKEKKRPLATLAGHAPRSLNSDAQDVFENQYLYEISKEPDAEIVLERLAALSEQERRWYLIFRGKIQTPWLFSVALIKSEFKDRQNATNKQHPYEPIMDLLPLTTQLIKALPFRSLGRAVIYGSHPGAKVPPHRDWEYQTELVHQININPGGYRPVYVYDNLSKEKIYLNKDCLAYILNTLDVHGVDAISRFTYTLRVDGTFTEEFVEQLKASN